MDHLIPATPAQDFLDPIRPVAGDPFGIRAGISRQAARHGTTIGADDHDGITALEQALDDADSGGQQRPAGGQRARRAGIDPQRPHR